MRLATRGRSAANIRGTVGRFTEPPFSEPPSAAAAAAAVNRRHEHSATAAERFRSGRHRSRMAERALGPKVPPTVGERAGYRRVRQGDETEKGERGKKMGGMAER